jgi:hypothetical protein
MSSNTTIARARWDSEWRWHWEPDFLLRGYDRDLTEVHLACRQIITVLGLEIRSRRVRVVNGALERR